MITLQLLFLTLLGISHIYLYILIGNFTKFSWKKLVGLGLFFTTILVTVLTITRMPEMNVVIILVLFILLGIIEKKKIIDTIYASLATMVLYTFIRNGLYILLYEIVMNTSIPYYSWTRDMLHFIAVVIILISLILLRNKLVGASLFIKNSKWYLPIYILLIIGTIFLTVLNYPTIQFLVRWNQLYGEEIVVGFLVIVVLLLAIVTTQLFYTKKRLEKEYEQKSKEQLLDYVKRVESMNEEMRLFRHDYLNLLASMEESIRKEDIAELQKIYHESISPTKAIFTTQQLELVKLVNIEHAALKSILSSKVVSAHTKKINILVDIPEPIREFWLPSDILIRIISILLDNAIEAANLTEEKIVQLAIFQINDVQYFIIKNSFERLELDITQLFEQYHSTKGENRGLGLYGVKKLIENYPNVSLATTKELQLFSQQLGIKRPVMNEK